MGPYFVGRGLAPRRRPGFATKPKPGRAAGLGLGLAFRASARYSGSALTLTLSQRERELSRLNRVPAGADQQGDGRNARAPNVAPFIPWARTLTARRTPAGCRRGSSR